jgi:predicted HAD superfamily Cof-like phosphohydrolase
LQFHLKMGLPVGDSNSPDFLDDELLEQRLKFMQEELDEMREVVQCLRLCEAQGVDTDPIRIPLLAKFFDGLLDLNYVSCGTAVMMGLPWEEGWELVQEANMAKRRVKGKDHEHHRGIIKPEGWKPPAIDELLTRIITSAMLE